MKLKIKHLYFFIAALVHMCIFAQNTDTQFYFNLKNKQISPVQALSFYLQFESVSGSEKEAGEFLKNLCKENGLFITQMGNSDGNYNFAASIHPLSQDTTNIIFLNHIDVVPAGDHSKWLNPPFSGLIIEDEIWGRGAFDNKGAAIMQLASIIEISRRYKNKPTDYNITFLAVSCEETQCEGGVKYVVDNYFDELNPCVIIGEGPPSLNNVLPSQPEADIFGISVAHKRPLWLKIEANIETSGHGSIPPNSYSNKELVTALSAIVSAKQKVKFNKLNTDLL